MSKVYDVWVIGYDKSGDITDVDICVASGFAMAEDALNLAETLETYEDVVKYFIGNVNMNADEEDEVKEMVNQFNVLVEEVDEDDVTKSEWCIYDEWTTGRKDWGR